MSASVTCRACHQPIVTWNAQLLTSPGGPNILNTAIAAHECGQGPLRCAHCGQAIAATSDLPEHLARAAAAVHRRYCAATTDSPQRRTRRKATA